MAVTELNIGDMVQHQSFGIGKVKEVEGAGDAFVIDFRSRPDHRMARSVLGSLTKLPDDGLAALTWDGSEEVQSWYEEAPLKLVAAVLADIGRPVEIKEIRGRIEDRGLLGVKWDPWWSRVKDAAGDSRHFKIVKSKNNAITAMSLVSSPSAVLAESLPPPAPSTPKPHGASKKKPPSAADWKKWLLGDGLEPAPGRAPTKAVCDALIMWPPKTVGQALTRTMRGAEEFLSLGNSPSQAATAWLQATSIASLRWRECMGQNADDDLAGQTGTLLGRLAQVAGFSERAGEWLLRAGALDGESDSWRREFAVGMWRVLLDSSGSALDLLESSASQFGRQGRAILARELIVAALQETNSARRHSDLDRILDRLPPGERINLFRDLVVRSAAEEVAREVVLDYVANSRHAFGAPASSGRLDLLVLASLSLTDGHDRVAQQASHEIREALSDSGDHNIGPGWGGLLSEARQYIGGLRVEYNRELESLRRSHADTVEEMLSEQERLNRRMEGLRSQIAEGREESRMDILQDILTEIAVSLQSFHQHEDGSDGPVRDIKAILARALRAGGADEFGTVGETVAYDPRLHQAPTPISIGSQVRICVPGAIVGGKLTGGRVLTQARVAQLSEGEQCK